MTAPPDEPLLTPREVAALYRVDTKTVTRWANAGWFPKGTVIVTPGGHRRYVERLVLAMREGRQP